VSFLAPGEGAYFHFFPRALKAKRQRFWWDTQALLSLAMAPVDLDISAAAALSWTRWKIIPYNWYVNELTLDHHQPRHGRDGRVIALNPLFEREAQEVSRFSAMMAL